MKAEPVMDERLILAPGRFAEHGRIAFPFDAVRVKFMLKAA